MIRGLWLTPVLVLALHTAGCEGKGSTDTGFAITSVAVALRFSGPRYEGSFYQGYLPGTHFAVWVEEAEHTYLQTLGISQSVISVGDYSHLDHLPTWQKRSGTTYEAFRAETQSGVAPSFDAVSRASVYFDADGEDTTLTFVWDLKDRGGDPVPEGAYRSNAEVANTIKDQADAYEVSSEAASVVMELAEDGRATAPPTQHILELSVWCSATPSTKPAPP